MQEKAIDKNGLEEFWLKSYDADDSIFYIEKNTKQQDDCTKQYVIVNRQQVERLFMGDTSWMLETQEPLLFELYARMQAGVQPKALAAGR